MGNNCAGLASKVNSFNQSLKDLKPAVFALQETKRGPNAPKLKMENLKNYQLFELNRELEKHEGGKGMAGGGILFGALHELQPILVRKGDDKVECMSVEIKSAEKTILFVTGYGPQLIDSDERKIQFWQYLSDEIKRANDKEIGIIIEIDSNAWAGSQIIPSDPNKQNKNGKYFEEFLKRNPHIFVVNSLSLCDGNITRYRKTIRGVERAIIDLFLVCPRILPLVKHMKVDHAGDFQPTNFRSKLISGKVTPTDHFPVILEMDLTVPIKKPPRKVHFNFRYEEGQKQFYKMTQNLGALSKCFKSESQTFQTKVRKWDKCLKSYFHQTFQKVRPKKRKFSEDGVGEMIERRKKMKNDNANIEEIEALELEIASNIENKHFEKVNEHLGHISGENGKVNTHGVWKTKNKIFPKQKPTIPLAIKDKSGNLITGTDNIKSLILQMFVERLRKRPMHPELKRLQNMKMKLAKMRLKLARKRRTPNWTMQDMEKAIKNMKNNKCRDPDGLINELLKPGVAGVDYKTSILTMLNVTKERMEIPDIMKNVNIAVIPKPGKKDKHNIENHRGIFLISKYRSLLMRMLLNDKYQVIDEHMSDSNIGGRKGRGIRDHLFIVNGIINEQAK